MVRGDSKAIEVTPKQCLSEMLEIVSSCLKLEIFYGFTQPFWPKKEPEGFVTWRIFPESISYITLGVCESIDLGPTTEEIRIRSSNMILFACCQ